MRAEDTTREAASNRHAQWEHEGAQGCRCWDAGASWQQEALTQAEADNDRLRRRVIAAAAALETCREALEAGQ